MKSLKGIISNNNQYESQENYIESTHKLGRAFSVITLIILLCVPVLLFILAGEGIDKEIVKKGLVAVLALYIPVGIIEFINYVPLVGIGGSYQVFITGNIANLKLPCALNALNLAGEKSGTPEAEIISTIAIATASIVTTIIIFIGVLLLIPFQEQLTKLLTPVAHYILPAIFGALGIMVIAQYWKLAVIPIPLFTGIAVILISLEQESLISGLIPVAAFVSVAIGRWMYNKGWLGSNDDVSAMDKMIGNTDNSKETNSKDNE